MYQPHMSANWRQACTDPILLSVSRVVVYMFKCSIHITQNLITDVYLTLGANFSGRLFGIEMKNNTYVNVHTLAGTCEHLSIYTVWM